MLLIGDKVTPVTIDLQLHNNCIKGELTIKNRMRFFVIKMYKYYQEVTNHIKKNQIF